MPIVMAKRLEKLQRNFLWGGETLEKKAHLIKWEVICSEKGQGDLSLRNLTLLNRALIGKWIWRFALESYYIWKRLIYSKFGHDDLG